MPGTAALTRNPTTGRLLVGGTVTNLAGTNFYDAVVTDNAPTSSGGVATILPRPQVTAALEAIKATGHNMVRIHSLLISQDKTGTAHPTPATWNENVMVAGDFLLAECTRLGLLIMAPAGDRWAFYHGGFASYATARGLNGLGDFLANATIPSGQLHAGQGVQDEWFQYHLAVMLGRINTITGRPWRDEIDILESGNEVYDTAFSSFHTRFTAYVKALPSGPRITADGSAASGNFPRDWALNDTNTDIVGTHLYDDQRLNGARVRDQAAVSNAKGKAYVVGEYDWRNASQSGAGGTIAANGPTRAQFLDDLRSYAQGAAWWSVVTPATSGHDDGYQLLLASPANAEQATAKTDLAAFNSGYAAASTTAPPAASFGTAFDDTFDGDGALSAQRWTTTTTTGSTVTRVAGRARLRLGTAGGYNDRVVISSRAPVTSARTTVRATITPDGKGGAFEAYLRLHLRAPNGNDVDGGDRYYLQLQSFDGAWGFFRKVGNTETILSATTWTPIPAWAADVPVRLEVTHDGPRFEVRVWTGTTRPVAPSWSTAAETQLVTPGYLGLSLGGGAPARAATWYLDDWSIATANSSTPAPGYTELRTGGARTPLRLRGQWSGSQVTALRVHPTTPVAGYAAATPPPTPPPVSPPPAPQTQPFSLTEPAVYFNDFSAAGLSTDWATTGAVIGTFSGKLGTNSSGAYPRAVWQPVIPSADMAIRARVTKSTHRGNLRLQVRCSTSPTTDTAGVYADLTFDGVSWTVGHYVNGTPNTLGTVPVGADNEMVTLATVGARAWLKIGDGAATGFDVAAGPTDPAFRHASIKLSTGSPQWLLDDLGVYVTTPPVGPLQLRYPRPAGYETWQTLRVMGAATTAGAETIDCGNIPTRIVFPPGQKVGPVRLNNTNNVVVIGASMEALPGSSVGGQDQRLLQITDAKGDIYLEGLDFYGLGADNSRETDALLLDGPTATFTVQNYRAVDLHGKESTNHADLIQIYRSCQALRVHNMTGTSDYQGIKVQLVSGQAPIGYVTLSNVDLIAVDRTDTDTTGKYMLWTNPNGETPVTLENVRTRGRGGSFGFSVWPPTNYSADPTKRPTVSADGNTLTYAASTNVTGVVTRRGFSDTTDFVPAGSVGASYVGPPASGRRTDYGSYRPDATTAGSYGTLTPYAGNLFVDTPNQVIEGLDVSGRIQIRANNVTVRRCRVRMEGLPSSFTGAGIFALSNEQVGALIQDCTVAPTAPRAGLDGIHVGGARVERCDVSGTVDGLKGAGNDTTVLGNHVHDLSVFAVDPAHSNGSHSDAFQFEGGNNTLVRGNSFRGSISTINTSCQSMIVTQNAGTVNGLAVDRNWFNGGYIPYNSSEKGKGAMQNFSLTNNVWGGDQTNTTNVHAAITAGTRAVMAESGNTVTGGVVFKIINADS